MESCESDGSAEIGMSEMSDRYKVEIKSPAGTLIDSTIIDGAYEAAKWMESKLAELPDGYLGHIQVIGGDKSDGT